jgi:hypothetical protein
MSLWLAPLKESASGVPRPQVTGWCLEPLLPRSTGLGPVFSPPDGADVRAVDRRPRPVDPVGLAELREQQLVQALPDALLLPLSQRSPARHARAAAHLLRQVFPRDPRLQLPVSTFRSSSRFRPGNRCRRSTVGINGSNSSQSSSLTNSFAICVPSFQPRVTQQHFAVSEEDPSFR